MDPAISAAAVICSTAASDMPQELALHLFKTGGFLIFSGVPEETEFGIDYKSWHVGPKFCGLKMIPPGVHFIFFSVKTAPRIGFFHYFKEKEILVRKWDRSREDMLVDIVSREEIDRIRANLENMDSSLGPYPYENYRSWFALSNHITEKTVERLRPENQYGRITGQAELVTMETEMMENESGLGCSSSQVDREHPTRIRFVDEQGLPIMRIRPGFEIRFCEVPLVSVDKRGFKTEFDRTADLEQLLNSLGGEWTELLAEIQFAFVCFLMGQVFEGFEQWKRLIHLLCSCTRALSSRGDLYMALLPVLHFQLKECPEDFFVDIVARDNFLTTTLSHLFANIKESEDADPALKEKSRKFKLFLTKKFKWSFDQAEDAPQVS